MNTRKILSLVVALAMLVTAVPAFGLVASAATLDPVVSTKTGTYKTADETVEFRNGTAEAVGYYDAYVYHSNWNQRNGMVAFTMPEFTDSVYKATLRLYTNGVLQAGNISIGTITKGAVWSPDTYTGTDVLGIPAYNVTGSVTTLPEGFSELDRQYVSANATWYEFDVTEYVKNFASGEEVSFVITHITKTGETTPSAAVNIAFAGSTNANAPQLVIETAAMADVTVEYKVDDATVKTDVQEVVIGESFTPDTVMFVANNELYVPGETTAQTITEDTTIPVNCTVADRYSSGITEVTDKNGITYDVVGESLILNGTFDYGTMGWTAYDWTDPIGDRTDIKVLDTKADNAGTTYTNVLADNGAAAGSGANTNVATKWPVEAGGIYYFAYDVMRDSGLNCNGGLTFRDANNKAVRNTIDNALTDNIAISNSGAFADSDPNDNVLVATTEWTRKAYIFIVPEGAEYVGFNDAWADDIYFDNFELYELEPQSTPTTVTVKYVDEAGASVKADKTVENVYVGTSYTYTIAADEYDVTAADRSKYYTVNEAASTLTIDSLAAEGNVVTVQYTAIDFKDVTVPENNSVVTVDGTTYAVVDNTNKVPNPSFETADGEFSILGWYSAQTGGTYAATGGDHSYKLGTDKYYYMGETITDSNGTANDGTYTPQDGNWAFGSRWNDGENGLCSIRNNFYVGNNKTYYLSFYTKATTGDDAVLDWGSVNGVTAGRTGNVQGRLQYDNATYADWTKVEVIITTDANNDCIQFNAYWLGDGTRGAQPYFLFDNFVLVEVEEVSAPTLTAELGWNEGSFAIDFVTGNVDFTTGYTYGVDFYAENSSEAFASQTVTAEAPNAGISTDKTNLIYAARPWVQITGQAEKILGTPVYTSIYALVTEDIEASAYTAETEFSEDRIAAAVDVINAGGIFVDETTGTLTDEMLNIVEDNGEGGFVLTDSAKAVGITFNGEYDTITIVDGEAQLSNSEATTEAAAEELFVLEEVELVYVPELVEESVVNEQVEVEIDFEEIL